MFAAFIRVAWASKAAFFNIAAGERLKSRYSSGHSISFLAWCSFFDPRLRDSGWLWGGSGSCHDVDASEGKEDESGELKELHGDGDCC
jgi:hypothetical protein